MNCNPKTYNRIKRSLGQLNAVVTMVDDERSCEEIVTQLTAVRSSLDKIIALITTQNLVESIENQYNIQVEDMDKAIDLLVKSK